MFRDDLDEARVGQVVEALDRSSEHASVVQLTVVDVRTGLEHLQLLLSKHNIKPQAPASIDADSDSKDTEGDEDAVSPAEELICVMVDAESEQLASVLNELKDQVRYEELRLEDEPFELAQLAAAPSVSDGEGLQDSIRIKPVGKPFGAARSKADSSPSKALGARRRTVANTLRKSDVARQESQAGSKKRPRFRNPTILAARGPGSSTAVGPETRESRSTSR